MINICIISKYFAPEQAIASVRWSKISKYLKIDHGDEINITVITNEKNFHGKYRFMPAVKMDPLLLEESQCIDDIIVIPFSSLTITSYKLRHLFIKLRGFISRKNVAKKIEDPKTIDDIGSFSRRIFNELREFLIMIQGSFLSEKLLKEKPDIIISSCGPLWVHGIAFLYKKRHPSVIWIADYRDPCFDEEESKILQAWKLLQERVYTKSADAVLTIQRDMRTVPYKKKPRYVVTNGYDPMERQEPLVPYKFSVVYTGSLGTDDRRDYGILYRAIRELIEDKLIDKDDVELIYAGPSSGTADKLAKKYNVESLFVNKGLVLRDESILLQRRAAILVQVNWNTKYIHTFWSGKMFEYMMSKKPIVYVVNGDVPHSLPSEYMDKLGGYCYEKSRHSETYTGMKKYILQIYDYWKKNGNVHVVQDEKYIAKFAYPQISEKTWKIMNALYNGKHQ